MNHGAAGARERDLVDQMAVILEQWGFPPVAGRVLGLLMICEPLEQSAAALADYAHASPGAISTSTRLLIGHGLVERARIRGDRKTYYRVRDGGWNDVFHAELVRIQRLREIADRALEVLADSSPERRARMEDFRDLNAFFETEYPALLARWDATRASKT